MVLALWIYHFVKKSHLIFQPIKLLLRKLLQINLIASLSIPKLSPVITLQTILKSNHNLDFNLWPLRLLKFIDYFVRYLRINWFHVFEDYLEILFAYLRSNVLDQDLGENLVEVEVDLMFVVEDFIYIGVYGIFW